MPTTQQKIELWLLRKLFERWQHQYDWGKSYRVWRDAAVVFESLLWTDAVVGLVKKV